MIFENIIGPNRPISWLFQFWPVLIFSFVGSLIATALCKRIALKFGIMDKPDDTVKTHKVPIAYLGGIGISIGLVIGIFAGIAVLGGDEFFSGKLKLLLGVLAGSGIACLVGVTDDIFEITPGWKIFGQVAAAVVLIFVGIMPNLDFLSGYLHLPITGIFQKLLEMSIVVMFVVGATNSLNLLDGLDGLCAGVTAIIAIGMLLLSIHLATWEFSEIDDPVRIIICLGLVGGVFGFLPFNRHPAKIFMGDAGSMLLGFVIASLMMLFAEQTPRWWLASIVVFGLPILDTAVALVRRLLNGRPLFVSDRGHIYDQMMDRGIGLHRTVTISYFLAGIYVLIGLLMSQIRTWYAAVVYVLVFSVSGIIVWKKGYLKMKGLRGAIQKEG